ncbi:MAG: diguanylate cyclase [Gemmatimonadales bacterium]|nr:MAG: diguanylate cyclase [Gemmatimonadales bacterium]
MAQPFGGRARESSPVPLRALGLSLLALSAPVVGALAAPDWMVEESGVLLWLTVLIPPFLLTYYRGWRGASLGLAGGMAALALAQVLLVSLDLAAPNFQVIFWMVCTYIGVCIGIGLLAELLRRERAEAEAMALTDPLTQLPNRRHASIFIDAAFAAGIRGEPVSAVLMDLDHFKQFNDRHGHSAGDDVLCSFAAALHRATRRMDLSCRWGGEEFLSVLSNCTAEGAQIFVGRVRSEFAKEEFAWGEVTFSAGVAQYGSGMRSSDELVAAADRALYEAKEAGRNCTRIAEAPPVEVDLVPGSRGDPATSGGPPIVKVVLRPAEEAGLGFDPVEEEASLTQAIEDGLPTGEGTILVVDDHAPTRRGIGRFLRRLGYSVVEAPDGRSALASARSMESLDLLLTDLVMPGMSGFTLMQKLEDEHGPHRVLYISGHQQTEVIWDGAPGSVIEYLSKPTEPAGLARAVRNLLDRPVPEVVNNPS